VKFNTPNYLAIVPTSRSVIVVLTNSKFHCFGISHTNQNGCADGEGCYNLHHLRVTV